MKKKKKPTLAPEEGPHGVDRWTSNGYGLMLDGKPVEPPEEDEETEEDIDEIEEV